MVRYFSRDDASTLFAALIKWREIVLARKAAASSDDELLTSGDEREANDRSSSTVAAGRSTSSWSKWWRGTTVATPSPVIEQRASFVDRPALKESVSAPAESDHFKQHAMAAIALPISGYVSHRSQQRKFVKTLRLTSDQLVSRLPAEIIAPLMGPLQRQLKLKRGANSITFSLTVTGAIACNARVFLWDSTDQVVVSDIDGTITKSDTLGHVMTFIGRDWTHSGVAKLYTDICRNGYKILYLTSRAIGQAGSTRHYLKGINQDNYQLPEGPVIMSPDRLFTSLHRWESSHPWLIMIADHECS